MLRLSRLPFVRVLTALAIAIASPGVEVGHGLAHEHERGHEEEVSHHDAGVLSSASHPSDHAHERVSQAVCNRGDINELPTVAAAQIVADLPAITVSLPVPFRDPRPPGDRATGPPPSLRAPPATE